MKSILYDLYYGNLDPASFYEPLLKEHRNFLRRKFDSIDKLEEKIEKDHPFLNEAFEKVLDFAFIEARWDTSNAFIQGFSIGARIMAESYSMDLSAKE